MTNILMTTVWTDGDILPFVQIGKRMIRRGHTVTLITHCAYQHLAEQSGLKFIPLDTPQEYDAFISDGELFQKPGGFASIYRSHVIPKIRAEYDLLCRHYTDNTLLVCRSMPSIAARLIAEKYRIPICFLYLAPSHLQSLALVSEMIGGLFGEEINSVREEYGLPVIYNWSDWLKPGCTDLGLWPTWFESNEVDLSSSIVRAGFILDDAPSQYKLAPELDEFLRNEKPVLITAGTGRFFDRTYFGVCLEACKLLELPSVVVTRQGDLFDLGDYRRARHYPYLPFRSVFPLVRSVIHHGGIGTMAEAIRAGIPQLIIGTGGDRVDNGSRARALGCGEYLAPLSWHPRKMADLIERLTTADEIASSCLTLSKLVRSGNGMDVVCDHLESLLGREDPTIVVAPQTNDGRNASVPQVNRMTENDVNSILRNLTPQQRAVLELKLQKRFNAVAPPLKIPRIIRSSNRHPQSFAQQRLWFLSQLEPDSSAYNVATVVKLSGAIDVAALERSLNTIVDRHEALRTTFSQDNDEPIQVIWPSLKSSLEVIDLRHEEASIRSSLISQLAFDEARRPFDLTAPPLMRASLVQETDDLSIFLLTMHHIVCDGWSMQILVREITHCYEAYCAGQEPRLPALAIQYVDYALWQREWLQGDVLNRQLDYWSSQLSSVPVLNLPSDRPRPLVPSYRGGRVSFALGSDLSDGLIALSQRENATLFMTLLAAFQVLLSRYTGQEDIAVGTPIANRTRGELEGVIGFFANTLVLRTDLSGSPSFRDLLKRVRRTCLEAYSNQDVSFEKIVEHLNPRRTLGNNPFFQILFQVADNPYVEELTSRAAAPSIQASDLSIDKLTTIKRDLTLVIERNHDGFLFKWQFSTDIFNQSTILDICESFKKLVASILANPDRSIVHLDVVTLNISIADRLGRKRIAEGSFQSVDRLLTDKVACSPEAIAVRFSGKSLTYHDLNDQADKLALYLLLSGVKPGGVVAIYMSRSSDVVVTILAILKSGSAFLPLDVTYPQDRIEYIIRDACVEYIVSDTHLDISKIPNKLTMINPRKSSEANSHISSKLLPTVFPSSIAYVIYTSGSTGQPKGVAITHGSLSAYVSSMQAELGITISDRYLHTASFAFSSSVRQMFVTLCSGASVILAKQEEIWDPVLLIKTICDTQATVMDVVPSYVIGCLSVFESSAKLHTYFVESNCLRLVLTASEPLHTNIAAKWQFFLHSARLVNMYGQTETTGIVSTYPIQEGAELASAIVPLGSPIRNTAILILDRWLQPVPHGVVGEICIAGLGLARGYLHHPDLTAERFIPHPLGAPGERLYRTGDLGRRRSDGVLEYVGRADHQVKVRGYRVELGEIEARLTERPDVKECVVVGHSEERGGVTLVAYIVTGSGGSLEGGDLRDYLRLQLPEYMVPSVYEFVARLPRTPNGKIDRKALPAPCRDTVARPVHAEPTTAVEQVLVEIWQQVLGIDRVSIYDNFFELGGDSIRSIQVVSKARQKGLTLSTRDLFLYQEIADLASHVVVDDDSTESQHAVTGEVGLTPLQHWYFRKFDPKRHLHTVEVLLKSTMRIDPELATKAVGAVYAHHDALRSYFQIDEGLHQYCGGLEGTLPFSVTSIDTPAPGNELHVLMQHAEIARSRIDVLEGPLFYVTLFQDSVTQEDYLHLIAHRLIIDAVSWRIIIEDLQSAYEHLLIGELPSFGPKSTSLQTWIATLTNLAHSPAAIAELDYWRQQQDLTRFPIDFDSPDSRSDFSVAVVTEMDVAQTSDLVYKVTSNFHIDVEELLLIVVIYSLFEHAGSLSIVLEMEKHGRSLSGLPVDVGRTVGWMANRFPVRFSRQANEGLRDVIRHIKEQYRRVPSDGIGYGALACYRQDTALWDEESTPRILFSYLGHFNSAPPSSAPPRFGAVSTHIHNSADAPNPYSLNIVSAIEAGRLKINWGYCSAHYREKTIRDIAKLCEWNFEQIIHMSNSPTVENTYTSSDFPLANLDTVKLNQFLSSLVSNKSGDETIAD